MKDEKTHIFDKPRNVRRVLRTLYAISAVLLATDFVYRRHELASWEGWYGFYAVYGFVACVLLVLIAKEMRKFVMRREDHYDD
jgi:archaellum biogenesis protein FlaJ (TadC family)